MDDLTLVLVTPYGEMFNGPVKHVYMPGKEGEFGVLKGHSALLALLTTGIVEIEHLDGSTELVAINWGYVEIADNHVNALIDSAVCLKSKENSKISEFLNDAKALLESATSDKLLIANAMHKLEMASK
ncbi:F0F1 ATP synthase subunit epsilon [Helicobacter sp. 13S00401-1]|uniref:ATP synthase F1 subunit epsilon n=1 Tax=Helicobacter sp. 13S00401-1 TaxID=1905758 RepID=UPI000BA53583|nr:ATP synthase F1 subunit epsilon [Helicobacter sp. 13S00401-1]PAF50281.1 F0F1 ATP synthase subunit epsilon [Helicobacter sp. 13S00401-1]